jgi:alpha-L-fucosidase
MKKSTVFYIFGLLLIGACHTQSPDYNSVASPRGTEIFQPNWDTIAQHYEFPEWFRDAKFGIFIHWGVYAVPAFKDEWYPRYMYQMDNKVFKHHVETYGEHTTFGYKDFVPMFKAENFNADEWVQLFKAAGAKYVVPVAEHHDGFAMYETPHNPWNAVRMGPKRDIIKLLKKAIEKEGLIFGLSSHRLENAWFFNGGLTFPSDVQDTTISLYGFRLAGEGDYDDRVGLDWLIHTRELIDRYQPQLMWFDWSVHRIQPYFNKFMAYYYNNAIDWKKGVVVNTKMVFPDNIQVFDMERGKLDTIRKYPWQTDTSIGKKSWCYIEGEENKMPQQIVHDLIDIVSKNGNLLLNVGPRADGTITEEQKEILLAIGKWLQVNGEAIYGTRCWVKYGEGDRKGPSGSFSDNTATEYTAADMRFTTKGNNLYAMVLQWGEEALVTSLNQKTLAGASITGVQLLGSAEPVQWQQTGEGLKLVFPKEKPCDYAYAFKITFDKLNTEN